MNVNPKLLPLLVPTATLVLDPKNARKHSQKQVELLAQWLEKHALNQPIVLKPDGKTVSAGNCVLRSFRYLGWEKVPAVEYAGEDVREFGIVDNRSAELSSWDIPVLKDELAALENLDVGSLGFEVGDLTNLGIDLAELSAGLNEGVGDGSPGGEGDAGSGAREFACPRCGKRFSG